MEDSPTSRLAKSCCSLNQLPLHRISEGISEENSHATGSEAHLIDARSPRAWPPPQTPRRGPPDLQQIYNNNVPESSAMFGRNRIITYVGLGRLCDQTCLADRNLAEHANIEQADSNLTTAPIEDVFRRVVKAVALKLNPEQVARSKPDAKPDSKFSPVQITSLTWGYSGLISLLVDPGQEFLVAVAVGDRRHPDFVEVVKMLLGELMKSVLLESDRKDGLDRCLQPMLDRFVFDKLDQYENPNVWNPLLQASIEIQELRSEFRKECAISGALRMELKSLNNRVAEHEAAKRVHEQEVGDLKDAHWQELEALKESHLCELEALKDDHSHMLEGQKVTLSQELQGHKVALGQELEAQKLAREADLATQKQLYAAQLDAQQEAARRELAIKEATQIEAHARELESQKTAYKSVVTELVTQRETHAQQLEAIHGSPIVVQSYLWKKKPGVTFLKSYDLRYFVLRANTALLWYKSKDEADAETNPDGGQTCKGSVILNASGARLELGIDSRPSAAAARPSRMATFTSEASSKLPLLMLHPGRQGWKSTMAKTLDEDRKDRVFILSVEDSEVSPDAWIQAFSEACGSSV